MLSAALFFILLALSSFASAEDVLIGELEETNHGVSGAVYSRGDVTLVLKDFHYDGSGPDALFFVGTDGQPIQSGKVKHSF